METVQRSLIVTGRVERTISGGQRIFRAVKMLYMKL